MEVLIKFLSVGYGYGNGYSYGNGYGYGYGNGYGNGNGNGNGDGNGYGNGYGDGYGDGNGDGYGDGNGYGNGYGSGDGSGDGILEIDGHQVYKVDGIPTIIESVHGNYAKGYTLKQNVILVPCYIAKVGDYFAHGATLHEAMADAEAKYNQSLPLEERIKNIIAKYPTLDTIVPNRELFVLHNLLTGSCKFGREQFCANHGISLDDSMTMQEFINRTRNDYGCHAIVVLESVYQDLL